MTTFGVSAVARVPVDMIAPASLALGRNGDVLLGTTTAKLYCLR